MAYKYDIDRIDMGESDRYHTGDFGRYSQAELSSFGNTLAELLENAEYYWIDQDGGEIDNGPADDQAATDAIMDWFKKHGEPQDSELNEENPDKQFESARDLEAESENKND